MVRLVSVGLALLASACGGGGGGPGVECGAGTIEQGAQCLPIGLSCGSGTHETSGECRPDGRFEIRARSQIRADGHTPTELRVIGSDLAGAASHELVVVSSDRPTAGTIVSPSLALGDRGGSTTFMPCSSVDSGCTGPVNFFVALASAPQAPLSHVTVELVAPPAIGSVTPCLAGGNILHIDAQNFGFTGTLTIGANGVWDVFGAADRARIQIVADNVGRSLEMGTRQLDIPLEPSVYEGAQGIGVAAPGEPTFHLDDGACGAESSFQIHEFTYDAGLDDVTSITATFEQVCTHDSTRRRTGCVHYAQ